jgi:hypothetical protein
VGRVFTICLIGQTAFDLRPTVPLARPKRSENPLRQTINFASRFKLICFVSPQATKIPLSVFPKLCLSDSVPHRHGGRTRRHARGAECGGRDGAD